EVVYSLRPVVLIVHLWDYHLGCSGQRGCSRSARAAVVDDGFDPFEEQLLVDLADGQAVGFVVQKCQVGPTAGHDRTPSKDPRCLNHHLAEVRRGAHAAEAEVDGPLAGLEKRLQLPREWALVR